MDDNQRDPKYSESQVLVEPEHHAVIDEPLSDREIFPSVSKSSSKRSSSWSKLIGVLILCITGGLGWWGWQNMVANPAKNEAAQRRAPIFPVRLASPKTETVQDTSEFVGNLEAKRSAALRAETPGRLVEILVRPGDRVRQGQIVARLESEELQAKLRQDKAELVRYREQLRELQAGTRPEEIAQAQARLAQAQARLAETRNGPRQEEIARARAQVNAAKAQLDLAKKRVDRNQFLQQEGAVSRDVFDAAQTQYRNAAAEVERLQRQLDELLAGSRKEEIALQTANVAEAKSNLERLQNGARKEEIARARAQVAESVSQIQATEAQLQRTQILAPFSGTIGDISLKVGDYLSQANQFTVITDNDALDLRLQIPLERSSQLRSGLPVQLIDTQGKSLATGQVSFISPNVDSNAQTVLIRATFNNENGQLRNQQSVRAKVIWSEKPGLLVPTSSISRLGGETFVFVAETKEPSPGQQLPQNPPSQPPSANPGPQLVARQKPVKLGQIQGNYYHVIEGINPNDQVIVSGILNLSEGVPIVEEKAPESNNPSAGEQVGK